MPNLRITELGSKRTEDAEQSFSSRALAERRQNEFCSPLYDGSNDFFNIPSATPNFRTELAGQLAELVPEAVADGKLDVEKLRELLTDDAADSHERFGLFWPGKKRALHAAQTPSTATLKPDLANSKDWDTTQNVFIEGDNLEVLKILQRHYHNKVKLIYIDPPYNTGKDFVYPDNYKEGLDSYLEWTRQVNEEGKKVSTNSESEGRYHSNWLNMMYPRLKLARNLLTDDGVIFISIDDNEADNLKKLCNEVFGEDNFVADLVWQNKKGGGNDAKFCAIEHEHILFYAKRINVLPRLFESFSEDYAKRYKERDGIGRFFWDTFKRKSGKQYYPITCPDGSILEKDDHGNPLSWLRSESRFLSDLQCGDVKFERRQDGWSVLFKQRMPDGKKPRSLVLDRGTTSDGSAELLNFFKRDIFSNPKPASLVAFLLGIGTKEDDIILDFFAGSATTAHAVMQLNAEDNGKRRFIMVQLPEPTPENSEARKAGFATIADISRKRIELAGEKIKSDVAESHLDTGFRAYKLTDTHFTKWRVTSDIEPDKLTQHLLDLRDSSTDDASPDDLLTELLLKLGYSLSEPLNTQIIAGLDIRTIAGDGDKPRLLAYLNERTKPTLEQLRELVNTEPTRLIILEDAFHGDDELKTNIAQYASSKGIELRTA
ncbi:site-specific DNA-methyltransferase [Lonsdalea quercina]|uniref:site-specific DNA-methyltransferase n=1 Tax=Lonsdalea quercina TaxID=71657 RepID=UPI003974BB5C